MDGTKTPTYFRLKVKSGNKEVSVEFPYTERSMIGWDEKSVGASIVKLTGELIEKLNKIEHI